MKHSNSQNSKDSRHRKLPNPSSSHYKYDLWITILVFILSTKALCLMSNLKSMKLYMYWHGIYVYTTEMYGEVVKVQSKIVKILLRLSLGRCCYKSYAHTGHKRIIYFPE